MTNNNDTFDTDKFETRLECLKDTQDSIQQMSSWCLQQRAHHKKIVSSWLNVFKKVRVEHRLVLFYLANDVIQYSKRKRYEFVESWATALQRATTMVRDDKVRNKIFRIFGIWEQRGIYSEEFIGDLTDLLKLNQTKKTQITPNTDGSSEEFQNSALTFRIRECVEFSARTDKSFKNLPKAPNCDIENLKVTLKDKSHSDDVEKEFDRYISSMETHRKHLISEIKSRKAVLTNLAAAIKFYSVQRGEVKVVTSAYKNFGNRIKLVKKKLDEIAPTLPSPLPSPDINAPSPEPDSDINLPDDQNSSMSIFKNVFNGYTSYLDGKLPFDINDFKRDESPNKSSASSASQPIEVIASRSDSDSVNNNFTGPSFYKPEPISSLNTLHPYSPSNISVPMPPAQPEYSSLARPAANNYPESPLPYGVSTNRYNPMMPAYTNEPAYVPNPPNNYNHSMPLMPPPMPPVLGNRNRNDGGLDTSQTSEFNSTWDMDMSWTPLDSSNSFNHCIDAPISPVPYDRDSGIEDRIPEYSEQESEIGPLRDVDHRQLILPVAAVVPPNSGSNKSKTRPVDIDHRNLISLTGSPTIRENDDKYKKFHQNWNATKDQDFRVQPNAKPQSTSGDVDYRTFSTVPIEEKKAEFLPLEPPPMLTGILKMSESTESSNSSQTDKSTSDNLVTSSSKEERGYDPSDMVESIDMDMSDEDLEDILKEVSSTEGESKDTKDDQLYNPEQSLDEQDSKPEIKSPPQKTDEGKVQSANVSVTQVSYQDNLIPVTNNRLPLLDTPPPKKIQPWENQQVIQGNNFQQNFEDQSAANVSDSLNNIRPQLINPWKQSPNRMPFRIPAPLENPQQQTSGFPSSPQFSHQQQFPRFQRSPFLQSPRQPFGQHQAQNHFRGSPRQMRGNPFLRPRTRGGIIGNGANRGNFFRGNFRGNPWQ